jgi:hypothetical protein
MEPSADLTDERRGLSAVLYFPIKSETMLNVPILDLLHLARRVGGDYQPRTFTISEVVNLSPYDPPLHEQDADLQDSNNGQNGGEYSNPIGRRFLSLVISGIGAYYAAWWGTGQIVCRRRRALGISVIVLSLIGFTASDVLLFLTGFRWSWGWWW